MHLQEKTIDSEPIFDGKIIKVRKDSAELENGAVVTRELVIHPGGVCIVPVDDEGNVYMVKQFRYPFQTVLTEIPAGKLEAFDTDPLDAAKRELKEEIGVTAKEFIPLGIYIPSPAILSERIYVYLARGLSYGTAHPDEDEFLDYRETPLCQLIDMIMNDQISDGKTVFGLFKAAEYLRRQEREANG